MPPTAVPAGGRVVAVTGACTYLGGELLRQLEEGSALRARARARRATAALAPGGRNGEVEFVNFDLAADGRRRARDAAAHAPGRHVRAQRVLSHPSTTTSGRTSSRMSARCTCSTRAPASSRGASSWCRRRSSSAHARTEILDRGRRAPRPSRLALHQRQGARGEAGAAVHARASARRDCVLRFAPILGPPCPTCSRASSRGRSRP